MMLIYWLLRQEFFFNVNGKVDILQFIKDVQCFERVIFLCFFIDYYLDYYYDMNGVFLEDEIFSYFLFYICWFCDIFVDILKFFVLCIVNSNNIF